MKIKPVILCGGSGERLKLKKNKNLPKQFINFGNWTLFDKVLNRIKSPVFDSPVISTNSKYIDRIKEYLKKHKIKDFKIILEPVKKNTAPAILSSVLIKDIPLYQPLIFFTADHLLEKVNILYKEIKINQKNLKKNNIFIFGIKPTSQSTEFGYFLTKKSKKKTHKVLKFIEKPKKNKVKQIIKKKGYWNSGMFYMTKESIINNFKKYDKKIYKNCNSAVLKSKYKNNIYYLNKQAFSKIKAKSFDYAILEKTKKIFAIKLNIPWSDLGSWKEICKMYKRNKKKYFDKKNVFKRPWGNYVNLFNGNEFLIKELNIKPKGILSLQKHNHRSEHWLISQGKPKITLNKKEFTMKPDETIFIPKGSIHRIENPNNEQVKIIEAQVGSILRETDIIRFEDKYGRVSK